MNSLRGSWKVGCEDSLSQLWTVSNGVASFMTSDEDDADWLCELLNKQARSVVKSEAEKPVKTVEKPVKTDPGKSYNVGSGDTRVSGVKRVREATSCGLADAVRAWDLFGDTAKAIEFLNANRMPVLNELKAAVENANRNCEVSSEDQYAALVTPLVQQKKVTWAEANNYFEKRRFV